MKMQKKVMAVLLITVMILASCLCVASADEIITVNYWNADSTKIMIDLSEEVGISELENAITLTKDGEPVSFVVDLKQDTSTPTSAAKMTQVKDTSYVILPYDGVDYTEGTMYNLKIDSALLGQDYELAFSLEKIWKDDMQNYSGTGASSSSTCPWYAYAGGGGTVTVETEGDNKYLQMVSSGSGKSTLMPSTNSSAILGDTGKKTVQFFDADMMGTEDYTVEVKVKFLSSTSKSFRISMQDTRTWADHKYTGGIAGGAYYGSSSNQKKMVLQASLKNDEANRQAIAATQANISALPFADIKDQPFDAAEGEWDTLSMSAKGGNVKIFAGNNAFINYNHTVDIQNYGFVGFISHSTATFCIDDVVVTKAHEYKKAEYTISPSGDDVAIGNEVTLTFEKDLDAGSLTEDSIQIFKNDAPYYGFSIEQGVDAKEAVIKFDTDFDYKTTYTIQPVSVAFDGDSGKYYFDSISFTTEPPGYELVDFMVDGEPNMSFLRKGTYNVSATFNNHKITEGMTIAVSICLFDSDLRMVDISYKEMILAEGENDTITDTWTIETNGKYMAKCFVWDSLDGMVNIVTETIE